MSGPPSVMCIENGSQDTGAKQEMNALTSSSEWLKTNGLKQSKLSLTQVLMQIGFRHSEDYVHSLGKSVSSQYSEGLFPQFMKDGTVYNLLSTQQQLEGLCEKLECRAKLYRRRLDWLTTGSRQLFGVIQERVVTLVLDFGGASTRSQYQLSRHSLCRVIREQVSQMDRFNLIHSGVGVESWQEKAVDTSEDNLRSAEEWLSVLEWEPSSQTNTANALLKAMEETMIESVYLFAVGDFKDNITDVLWTRLVGNVCPIHTVSFNAKKEKTFLALKDLSHLTAGRFHAFAEMHVFGDESHDSAENKLGCVGLPRVPLEPIGGMPPGCGVREDVYLVWCEMEEASRTRDRIQAILRGCSTSKPHPDPDSTCICASENCLGSREWLSRFGLKAQKLTVHDTLADCAFHHSDGVVDIKCMPEDESLQTDAESRKKLVNAKYCSRFVHMQWRDGCVVHVYVTAEKCRQYEEKMKTVLTAIRSRLEWLTSGSRELFGSVPEDQVYLLIDTSESMRDHLSLVKDKVHQLIQEQLCHKVKVNMVGFGTRVVLWRSRLTEVSSQSLESACRWVKELQAGGSTNTLGALGQALADEHTQAVYLLTDGRPDQPPRTIMENLRLWSPAPVHTISFNCDDQEANCFLFELSQQTGGRFHSYYPGSQDPPDCLEPAIPSPYESEDLHLLRTELVEGKRYLESVLRLRAECVMLDSFHHGKTNTVNRSYSTSQLQRDSQCEKLIQRARSAAGSNPALPSSGKNHQPKSTRCAAHTKTSLLRLLSNCGIIGAKAPLHSDKVPAQDWMLPETLQLFQTNADKQNQILHRLGLTPPDERQRKKKKRKPKESLDISTAQWLKTNSLVARRLTMLDALAPTAIAHSGKYIPILEKHVYSKVFDEVLPLVHISSRSRTQGLTLVNPLAVNLEEYKSRLQEALQTYERRLNMIVWRALTQEEKDKFGGEPVPFRDHRDALLEALEHLGWPLAQEELALLEDQIHMALSFLQQASDLWPKQTARNTQTDNGSKLESISPETQRKPPGKALDSLRGQRVIARSEADGYYYPATVRKRLNGKRVMVDFSSGDSEIIPLGSLLTVGGSGPCPPLAVGDFVFVASGTEGAGERYGPGVVIATPRRLEAADKLFTVLKYTNKKVHTLRCRMIKISQTRYSITCLNLRQMHLPQHSRKTVSLCARRTNEEREVPQSTDSP